MPSAFPFVCADLPMKSEVRIAHERAHTGLLMDGLLIDKKSNTTKMSCEEEDNGKYWLSIFHG
jgi:hypothetical protein